MKLSCSHNTDVRDKNFPVEEEDFYLEYCEWLVKTDFERKENELEQVWGSWLYFSLVL